MLFYFTNCYQNLLTFHRRVVKVRIKKVWRHTWKGLTAHYCAAAHLLRNTDLNTHRTLNEVSFIFDLLVYTLLYKMYFKNAIESLAMNHWDG